MPRAFNPCSPWARPSHHVVRCVQGCTRRPDSLSFTEPQTRLPPAAPSVTGRDPQGTVRAQRLGADSSCDCKSVAYLEVLCRETSQTEKDNHCVVSLIHRVLKKNRSQTHGNRGPWLPEAPGEAGLPASATPQAPFFSPSTSSLCCEKRAAAWKSDARGGLRASLCRSHARPRLPAQTRGLGPPV
ncbi:unnamed protein product [Rangifer tarandus platyrhynchus]|uniref:Uncharacterized protein n=2 Tax=Rangifer tarandus platyrhynchus TaxID=3082113 RepID=A0ACB0EZT6_RANTA|nr:unnamed protein product [Rangifer tarandus platyrhynchus]CAI9706162.1 unnamed protein product [Rangifer tarandus platyrhynchus]